MEATDFTDKSEIVSVPSRNDYFSELKSNWGICRAYMQEKLSGLSCHSKVLENPVIRKRLFSDNPKLRPTLLKLAYEACGGADWKSIVPAMAAVEFLNISTYVTNAVFDGKGEEQGKKDINAYIITSMLLRDLADDCLHELKETLGNKYPTAMESLREINKQIYLGQIMDIYLLNKENFERFKSKKEMEDSYIERSEKFSGVFHGEIARIGGMLAGADETQLTSLYNFGINLGTGIQINSDLADFIYGKNHRSMDIEKSYQDLFSDLKQGKLTYPIIQALYLKGENIVKRSHGKKDLTQNELRKISGYISSSGIAGTVKPFVLKYFKKCKKELKALESTKARSMLSIMASMLRTNKYLGYFREPNKNLPTRK